MNKKTIIILAMSLLAINVGAQTNPMKKFIDDLMSKMTLHEKIGQLNLMVAGDITTGGAMDTKVGSGVAEGSIGGVFNVKGVDKIRSLQDIAVKKTKKAIALPIPVDNPAKTVSPNANKTLSIDSFLSYVILSSSV